MQEKEVKQNIEALLGAGYRIEYRGMESSVFEKNLSLIDSQLPENLAKVLLAYYARKGTQVKDLTNTAFGSQGNKDKQAQHK